MTRWGAQPSARKLHHAPCEQAITSLLQEAICTGAAYTKKIGMRYRRNQQLWLEPILGLVECFRFGGAIVCGDSGQEQKSGREDGGDDAHCGFASIVGVRSCVGTQPVGSGIL